VTYTFVVVLPSPGGESADASEVGVPESTGGVPLSIASGVKRASVTTAASAAPEGPSAPDERTSSPDESRAPESPVAPPCEEEEPQAARRRESARPVRRIG
jgi:hypothetical protein